MTCVTEQPTTTTPLARRRSTIVALVVLLVAAAAIAGIAWIQMSRDARESVRVLPTAMHCEEHDVPFRLKSGDSAIGDVPYAAFDVTLRPHSFCQLTVTFVNDGSRAVHVDSATFVNMAPGGDTGGSLEITQNGGEFDARDSGANDEGDAVIPIDETLAGGESFDVLFDMRPKASGFIGDPRRMMGIRDRPEVRVTSLGLHGTIRGTVNLDIVEKK